MLMNYRATPPNILCMPHFVIGNTFPRLAVKAVAMVVPLVGEATGNVGPMCYVKAVMN